MEKENIITENIITEKKVKTIQIEFLLTRQKQERRKKRSKSERMLIGFCYKTKHFIAQPILSKTKGKKYR